MTLAQAQAIVAEKGGGSVHIPSGVHYVGDPIEGLKLVFDQSHHTGVILDQDLTSIIGMIRRPD